jgi:hypothetical protein
LSLQLKANHNHPINHNNSNNRHNYLNSNGSSDRSCSSINSNGSNLNSRSSRVPAARARDATSLELLVSFLFSSFFFLTTNVYFQVRTTQHVEKAMAATAAASQARDAARLKPLVYFRLIFFLVR